MSQTELKELKDNLLSEWETFKQKNDERLQALENGDTSRADELDQQLDKYNERLDQLEVKIKKVHSESGGQEFDGGIDAERKFLNAFIRNDPDSKESFEAFRGQVKKGHVPDNIKSYVEGGYKHNIGFNPDELPDNLKTYGRNIMKKAMSSDSFADGGIFSLPNFEMEVVKGIRELSPVRQVARIRNINSGDSLHTTVRDTTISSQKAGERENVSDTGTPTYKEVRIQTHERSASPAITRQEIEDAWIDLVSDLQRDAQEEFAVQEGQDFISGSGVGEPEGILTNGDVGETTIAASDFAVAASGTSDVDSFNALIDLQSSLKQGYEGTWLFSRQTRGHIRKFKDGNDQYFWSPNVAAGFPNTILGDPYLLATDLASPSFSSNDVPVLYGDFQRGYYIVDRLGLDVLRDPYSNRPFIEIYMRRRVGGQVVLPEAIKKLRLT